MSTDYIAERVSWLDEIITHPDNPALFDDEGLLVVQKELSGRWVNENRLELLNDLAHRYGEEKVFAVIDKIIYANCKRNWEQTGKGQSNSFADFVRMLWVPLKDLGFEYSSETSGNQTTFHVTKCSIFELAQQMDAKKWFYHLVCLTDEPSVTGFNNKITFSRTKMLMLGDTYCNHCYTDHSS